MINLNVKLADLEDKVAATDHLVSWRCCFSIEREGVRTRQKLLNASLTIPLRHVKTRDIISTFVFVDIVLKRIRINPSDFYSVYMYLGLLGHFFAPPPSFCLLLLHLLWTVRSNILCNISWKNRLDTKSLTFPHDLEPKTILPTDGLKTPTKYCWIERIPHNTQSSEEKKKTTFLLTV